MRSKHFAITVCDALDIGLERVSTSLVYHYIWVSLLASDRNPVVNSRKNLLAVELGRPKGYSGMHGPSGTSLFLPSTVLFIAYLTSQANFPHMAKILCIVLQASDTRKKKADFPYGYQKIPRRAPVGQA